MAFITREDLPFLGYTAVTLSLRVIPRSWRLRWSRTLANGLGALWYRLDRSSAALAHKNLRAVLGPRLPDRKLEATAMAHFHNIALHKVINDMLRHLTRQELTRYVTVEGEEHLQQALAAGRGVVLLGAHSGAHGYIPLMVLKRLGYQITPVVGEEATPHNSWVYCHVVNPIRRVNWNEFPMINPVGTPQREMVECLRQGGILVIWPDFIDQNQDLLRLPAPHVLPAPLLGHTIPFKTGTFRLARWLGAPMLPFFFSPRPGGFTMRIEPPLPANDDKSTAGLLADLAAYTARFEPYLLRYPELWWQWRQRILPDLMRPLATEPESGHSASNESSTGSQPEPVSAGQREGPIAIKRQP